MSGQWCAITREVERHADAEEEQAEQDAAERLDVDLELMPEARFRQHHAGEERAHRHRQAAHLHHERRAEHHQQRGRRHHLARLRVGEHAEHRIEQPAAGREQRRDGGERDADREPARAGGGLRRRRRQERHQRQQRHDREVLQQQDRDQPLALWRRGVAALLQDLHHDGGGGEHEAHGGEERDQWREAGRDADAVSSVPQVATWAMPRPKISRRRLHSRDGCISSPITNRNITTPSSATCRIACGSVNSRSPNGPMMRPAAR